MSASIPAGEIRLLGDRAAVVGVRDAAAARTLAAALDAALRLAGVRRAEVVCGFATIGVVFEHGDESAVRAALQGRRADGVETAASGESRGRLVTVPCVFDGPDLDDVAALSRCAPGDVVTQLTDQSLTVAVVGFSPGFAYLDGLPASLARVPRRDRPRPVVPAGSVALANGHAAVYPTPSPGGWHLVGRTGFPLLSVAEPPYAVLAPGDRVRFVVTAPGDPATPPAPDPPAWSPPDASRSVFEVVAPGLRAALQDGGRRGVAAVGVPAAGPADPLSFALANALVGNPADTGVLELTGGGARLRCLEACHAAVVGGAPELRVDGAPVSDGRLLPLTPGQMLEVGGVRRGCRTYLGVAGGLLGPVAFASLASDELCRLGAGPLVARQRLWAGPWTPPLGDHLATGSATELPRNAPVELRVVPGPHHEWFRADALACLGAVVFEVAAESNRVGIRLRTEHGVTDLRPAGAHGELDSQCVVTGAVQVPPDGDPVVLLPDHATLGGYPVLAVVASADHGVLGQCAPGTRVRFVAIGHDEADDAWRAQLRMLGSAVVGRYPLAAG